MIARPTYPGDLADCKTNLKHRELKDLYGVLNLMADKLKILAHVTDAVFPDGKWRFC